MGDDMSIKAHRIAPWELGSGEAQHDVTLYQRHFLAEGDSWFSFGSFFGNSLLDALEFDKRALITQTAMPGDTLSRMADWWRDLNFNNLLSGATAWRFDAVFISGGGNDLINALQRSDPGTGVLKKFLPGNPPVNAQDCIDTAAFARFDTYLRANFGEISQRVAASALNAGAPIFVHTYDFATPRDSGAGPGKGPWLCEAFRAHNIPEMMWVPLMELLFGRLRSLIMQLALPNVFVIDTLGTLVRAQTTDTGPTLHWLNEIHPNADGYRELAKRWKQGVEAVLP
jgi:lysophospholipase L1-like esterase